MFINLTKLTIEQLILANVHIGHTLHFLTYKIKPYLLGKRQSVLIFNLGNTILQVKLCISVITKLISKRQKVLLIKERDLYKVKRLFLDKKFGKYLIFYDQK